MSIYHWLVVLVVFFSVLLHGNRKGNTTFIIVAAVLMFCVIGLRDNKTIGNDSRTSYRSQFYQVGEEEWKDLLGISDWWHEDNEAQSMVGHNRNFALPWLMKIVYELSNGDYQWFIVIMAILVLISESVFIQRFSPSPIQSILYFFGLLFFLFHFSATKQSMAMCLLLFSFTAIIEHKPIRFLILVVVASFFHFPALVFLPAYWIGNMRFGRGYVFILAGLFVLTYIFRERLIDLMTETYDTEINTDTTMRFLANKVLVMIVVIIAAFLIRPPDPEDQVYCTLLQLIGIATVIQTFASYNNTFERLADYYFQFSVVFIPMIFEDVTTKRRYFNEQTISLVRFAGPYAACAFAIWRFLDYVVSDVHFFPFRFFFQ